MKTKLLRKVRKRFVCGKIRKNFVVVEKMFLRRDVVVSSSEREKWVKSEYRYKVLRMARSIYNEKHQTNMVKRLKQLY